MPPFARSPLGVALGTLMVGLGLFIVLRLGAWERTPLTGALWLDVAFALFFLVRGGTYFWQARRRRPRLGEPGDPPTASRPPGS